MNSFSSINFEEEKNESSHEWHKILKKEFESPISANGEMLSSKILDEFSMIHYRKTK